MSLKVGTEAAAGIVTPATGLATVFVDSADKLLKSKDDAGVVTNYGSAGVAVTSLTGEVTGTGPGATATTVTNSAVLGKVLTGLTPTSAAIAATDTILEAFNKLANVISCGWFGNGADGVVTLAVDTTLIRDMFYSQLTINPGVTVFCAGFKIHCSGYLQNDGIIDRSGVNATSATGAVAVAAGTVGPSGAGGTGSTTTGAVGAATSNALGGSGGAGGLGASGAGGGGGVATVPTAILGGAECANSARQASVGQQLASVVFSGGAGGGGGGGDGAAGAGGGSGGGVIVICAKNLFGTGIIRAKGGNGFTPAAGNRGGSGGGGGGVIILLTENDTTTTSLTLDVAGGSGASGTGTGVAGAAGSTGRTVKVRT